MSKFPFKAGDKLIDIKSGEVICTISDVDPWNDRGTVILDFYNKENAEKWKFMFYQSTPKQRVNLNGLIEEINKTIKVEHLNEEVKETTPGEEIIEENTTQSHSYKDFIKALSKIDITSSKEIENEIKNILSNVEPKTAEDMLNKAKLIADEISTKVNECSTITESKDATKKSIKELIGEIFPSLSFYPALGIWSMVDRMVGSGKGFDALTPEQARLLPIYISLFFGLVGGKIAYNRLKEYYTTSDKSEKEINETLYIAGIVESVNDTEINSDVLNELYEIIIDQKGEDYFSDYDPVPWDEVVDTVEDFGRDIEGFDITLTSKYAQKLKDMYDEKQDEINDEIFNPEELEESKLINDDAQTPLYKTTILSDIINFCNSGKIARVIFDTEKKWFLYGDNYNYIHATLIKTAIENGLYPNAAKTNDIYGKNGIYEFCLSTKSVEEDMKSDGYSTETEYQNPKFFIYTRNNEDLMFENDAFRNAIQKYHVKERSDIDKQISETLRLAGIQLDETVENNLDDACHFVSSELQSKFGKTIPETEEEKTYADDLINMATMKFNVPEDSLKDKLGIIEEPNLEQDSEESVPGEKIEEV